MTAKSLILEPPTIDDHRNSSFLSVTWTCLAPCRKRRNDSNNRHVIQFLLHARRPSHTIASTHHWRHICFSDNMPTMSLFYQFVLFLVTSICCTANDRRWLKPAVAGGQLTASPMNISCALSAEAAGKPGRTRRPLRSVSSNFQGEPHSWRGESPEKEV